jgi:hypothetical protein
MATIDLVILLSVRQDDLPEIQVQMNKTKGEQGLLILSERGQALLYELAAELTTASIKQVPSVQQLVREAEGKEGHGRIS